MNTTNIEKLINHLRNVQAAGQFNTFKMNGWFVDHAEDVISGIPKFETKRQMETPHNECGAVACIAGHAAVCMAAEGMKIHDIQTDARQWLDLDYYDHCKLFIPTVETPFENISIADAIQVLEVLRDTGTINWEFVDERAMALPQV